MDWNERKETIKMDSNPETSETDGYKLRDSPSMSSGRKRPRSYDDAGTSAKRNCDSKDSLEVAVKCEYHPIASLTPALISPLVKGTVTSISSWRTYSDKNVTCMYFRLGDDTGEIPGVIYAPMSEDFSKDFTLRAEVVIENAKVQRLKPEFRTAFNQFQLVINQWTKIKVTAAPPEPVKTSIPVFVTSQAPRPITSNSPNSCMRASLNQSIIPVERTTPSNSTLLITVHTVPSNPMMPITIASGSRAEYSLATILGTPPISASACTTIDRSASFNKIFSNAGLSEYGLLFSINEIQSKVKVEDTIDLIGIAVQVGDPRSQLTRKGNPGIVREITLRDDTCSEIDLAIWGPDDSIIPPNSVLLIKKAKIILYRETKRLTCLRDNVIVDPDSPEAHRLKNLVSVPGVIETVVSPVVMEAKTEKIDEKEIPAFNGNFCSINDIELKIPVETMIDVIGLAVQVQDTKICTTRKGQNVNVTEVTLRDTSEINVAIWQTEGDRLYVQPNSVLLVYKAKVILYNDKKKLTCLRANVIVDPDIPEATRLKNLLQNVPVVNEKAQLMPVASAGTNSETSPMKVPLVNDLVTSIGKIHSEIAKDTKIDVIGFIVRMEDQKSRMTKRGVLSPLREVTLADDNGAEIDVAIWEPGTDSLPFPMDSVLLVKDAKVIVYNYTKKLTCQRACVTIDPNIPQAHKLKKHIEHMQDQETQKIEPVVPPDSLDDSRQVNETICDTPKASKTDDLDVLPRLDPVQHLVGHDEGIVEAQRLDNLPRSVSIVTEKARPMTVTVADTSSDIASEEDSVVTDRLHTIGRILSEIAVGTKVDLIGLAVRVGIPISRTARSGYGAVVRDVTLKDDSGFEIDVAIWESRENSSEIPLNCVLLINNCAVIFYNERKKLTCQRSCVSIDPNIPRARKLKKQMEVHTHTGSSIGSDVLSIRPIESMTNHATHRYTPIEKILDEPLPGTNVDILAVVTHRYPVEHLIQDNKDTYKAVIVIFDQTQRKITLTVWGPRALTLSERQYSILEGLNIRVHEINGEKQLICTEQLSTLNDDPEIEEAKVLRQWFDDVWLKTEESCVTVAANYESNSKNTCDDTQIHQIAHPEPTSPELATYTPIDHVLERVSDHSIINVIGIVDWVTSSGSSEKVDRTYTEIKVLDDSRQSIWVIVWGDKAPIVSMCGKVVAMINVTVRVHNNIKHLVFLGEHSSIFVEPCIERTQELLNWYKVNEIDKLFDENILPITANNLVFSKFKSGDRTSVIGVVVKIHECRYVQEKTFRLDVYRKIELIDDSEETINLLMWGEHARDFIVPEETILLVTNVRVFVKNKNRVCVTTAWSHFDVDPTEPLIQEQINRIKLWWCSYKIQHSQDRVSIPTSRAAVDDVQNPITIIKTESILKENDCNESVDAKLSANSSVDEGRTDQGLKPDMDVDKFDKRLEEDRKRWDFL